MNTGCNGHCLSSKLTVSAPFLAADNAEKQLIMKFFRPYEQAGPTPSYFWQMLLGGSGRILMRSFLRRMSILMKDMRYSVPSLRAPKDTQLIR